MRSKIANTMHPTILLLWFASLFLAACSPSDTATPAASQTAAPTVTAAPAAEAINDIIEVTRNIQYANVDDRSTKFDVYAPIKHGVWPVVVTVHGGGGQGRKMLAPLAEAISSEGAVVYNISVLISYPMDDDIERIACAVRFARATAADYGGDPDRITLVGYSYGASTGAIEALAGDNFEGDCVVNEGDALPDAFVGWEGGYNEATNVYDPLKDHTVLKDEDPELWEAINLYSHIGRNADIQVHLIHGDDEHGDDPDISEVSPQVTIDFYEALKEAGYAAELIMVDGASHADLTWSSDALQLTVQHVMDLARGQSQ